MAELVRMICDDDSEYLCVFILSLILVGVGPVLYPGYFIWQGIVKIFRWIFGAIAFSKEEKVGIAIGVYSKQEEKK